MASLLVKSYWTIFININFESLENNKKLQEEFTKPNRDHVNSTAFLIYFKLIIVKYLLH